MAQNPQVLMKTSRKGWRRTAIINVVLTFTYGLTLLILLAINISRLETSLYQPSIIFFGSCTTSSWLNLFLHFLINVISTAVLSSSNFFMQILNAPSRQEIDRAHTWLQSLDIGIPSIRNLSHVSRLKSASWLIFLITSIPIHLLFNSSVFETTYDGSQWYLTFATEAFTQGAPFFPPGASLLLAGSLGPDIGIGVYGEKVSVDQYWNASSIIRQKIESVAKESHSWTILSAEQCYSEYVSCNPRGEYGDVIFIINSTASEEGWKRSDIFTFDPSTNLSASWNPHIPPNAVNSLWFSAQCNVGRTKSTSGRDDTCTNVCLGAMGFDRYKFRFNETLPMAYEPWLIPFFPAVRHRDKSLFGKGLEFNDKFDLLHVNHCLAKPVQPSCKVGLSNALLLIVIVSIFVKAIQGGVVAWKLPSASLVTLGDAIESFILYPDTVTLGISTLSIADAQRIEFEKRRHRRDHQDCELTTNVQPRRWKGSLHRLGRIIPYSTWVQTYSILFAGVSLLSAGFAASSLVTRNNYYGSLDHSNGVLSMNLWGGGGQAPGYIATLLLANAPQVILSLCYYSYNSLLTRLHIEKEWDAFNVSYRPLRVSYPAGQQISSYRLQLPYRQSVPLILISITLHWLVSNAVFLFVNEGGYWNPRDSLRGFYDAYTVPDGSLISIGYSPFFLLVLFIASFLFIIFPPALLGFFNMKGNMVAGGWNSLVISAACHVPDMEDNQDEQSYTNEAHSFTREYSRTEQAAPDEDEVEFRRRLNLTQRKIRWGAVEMPSRLSESISNNGKAIFHLGFGGKEHNVSEPKSGQYYV